MLVPAIADDESDRVRLSEYLLAHKTVAEIAEATGWSRDKVSKLTRAVKDEWSSARVQNIDELVAKEISKLDTIERGLAQQWLTDKSLWVVDRLFQVQDRRAKLLGLNAPEKVDLVSKVMAMTVNTDLPYSAQQIISEAESIVKSYGHRER